jgi:hypothetical protein
MEALLVTLRAGPPAEQGISFLTIKSGLLGEYNMNLAYLLLRKARGEPLEGDPAVERLCRLRTLIEKVGRRRGAVCCTRARSGPSSTS